MPQTVINVENISKSFDKNVIFENCSLSIEAGTVFGLVGLNGSGKTTFIRLLLGLLKPERGGISVLGHDPWKHDPHYFKKLGVILDHDGFAGNMTIAENLRIFAEAKGLDTQQVRAYVEERWKNTFLYDEFFGAKKKVKYLSRGQKMQCAICRAFLPQPDVYFLDEPTVALDVDAIDHFYSLVTHARDRGVTVLISSHQLSAIEDLCDCVGMLHNRNVTIVASASPGSAGGPVSWMVRCDRDADARFGKIIENICGFPAVFSDSAWHFKVTGPQTSVPEIVRQLASDGCRILEVGAEAESLKDRIRSSRSQPEDGA
jgi:ABC-type multidrug transport system ATPase subunit